MDFIVDSVTVSSVFVVEKYQQQDSLLPVTFKVLTFVELTGARNIKVLSD